MSDELDVIGGAGGLEARYDDLGATAGVLQSAAVDVADTAMDVRRVLTDTGLLASAALDPGGFARVEAAVLSAIAGRHGLLCAAAGLEERSLLLRAAVARYELADSLGAGLRDVRHWAEGTAAAVALPLLPFVAATSAGVPLAMWMGSVDVNTLLAEHPGLAEEVAGASPAFVSTAVTGGLGPLSLVGGPILRHTTGTNLLPRTVEDAAGLIALMYPAGSASVASRGVDVSAPPVPRGIGDLLLALDHRNGQSTGPAQGEIDVRRLTRTRADGTTATSWIVDLPGTKDWQIDPRSRDHLNDLATNLTTMAGDPSARVDGVTQALTLAGVGPGEPVMLVGHSQGGLVAMRAAEQYARDGRFAVTHVVTAGSPISRIEVPPSVQVLSLENRYDVVPRLDGEPPPDDTNRVTVVFDRQTHDVGRNHETAPTYLQGARAADAATGNASLAQWRAGAAAFLAPTGAAVTVRTTVWDIRNGG